MIAMSGLYLLEMEGGDLAYAIAMLIMAGAAGIAGHFKKKKAQEEFEEEIHKRAESRAAAGETPAESDEPIEPTKSDEIPDVAELFKMIIRRKAAVPDKRQSDPQAPRVEPPLKPARRTRTGPEPAKGARPAARKAPPALRQAPARPKPQRRREPERISLGALHGDKVTIDSTEHARHIAVGAEQVGRTAEAHAGKLGKRHIGSSLAAWGGKSQARGSRFTRADLRRAIIMNEVLGKPVALRDPTAS